MTITKELARIEKMTRLFPRTHTAFAHVRRSLAQAMYERDRATEHIGLLDSDAQVMWTALLDIATFDEPELSTLDALIAVRQRAADTLNLIVNATVNEAEANTD